MSGGSLPTPTAAEEECPPAYTAAATGVPARSLVQGSELPPLATVVHTSYTPAPATGIPVDGMPAGHADGNPFYPGAPITAGMETGAQGGGAGRHQQQQYYPQFPSGAAQFNIPGQPSRAPGGMG
eukprot:CAMPEP_0198681322 /NCGR_PEP_ID=MMETSP1468-20131203/6587_1 /TAXON_ID=1461545 /ORGANISM="Mantoniella sp, Strain CCMP1436" /LENGTH=124 /DNA_ID=CAMNT_0044422869 /DNA_START=208 /DNA_END=578 /DNA_ORIENTATION=+